VAAQTGDVSINKLRVAFFSSIGTSSDANG
jgi:hypothetical protein